MAKIPKSAQNGQKSVFSGTDRGDGFFEKNGGFFNFLCEITQGTANPAIFPDNWVLRLATKHI